MQFNIVCPKCEKQALHELDVSNTVHQLTCRSCLTSFKSGIATVRAKRSRGDSRAGKRLFSVRTISWGGQEELIEFVNAGYQDFELRAKDVVIFTSLNNELRVVQNSTIRQYMKVSKPSCYLATHVYGPNSVEVKLLRTYRDEYLLSSRIAAGLVSYYYRLSPLMIQTFKGNKLFSSLVALGLRPIVSHVKDKYVRRPLS